MPSAATATSAASFLLGRPRRRTPPFSPPAGPPRYVSIWTSQPPVTFPATAAAVSSSTSAAGPGAEPEAARRVGARVRVTAPVRVHHVQRAPELELEGMEGVIRQYVGLWKGRRVSANLPFRVEFALPGGAEGLPGPVKFFAHLREGEFEYRPL